MANRPCMASGFDPHGMRTVRDTEYTGELLSRHRTIVCRDSLPDAIDGAASVNTVTRDRASFVHRPCAARSAASVVGRALMRTAIAADSPTRVLTRPRVGGNTPPCHAARAYPVHSA